MAKRRMMSLDIVDTDIFLDMPSSTQNLYFHYLARADDDGFLDSPKKILKVVGCTDDDLKLLILKKFVIPFESGICVITHWKIHNYIRSDRYKSTLYLEEKKQLQVNENGSYELLNNVGIPNDIPKVDTGKDRLGKDSIGKNSIYLPTTETVDVPEENVFIKVILNDKSLYSITNDLLNQYKELYPAVNVEQELRKFAAWSLSNPTKRKTKKGILRSINSWLSKEQDKGGNSNATIRTSNTTDLSKYDR